MAAERGGARLTFKTVAIVYREVAGALYEALIKPIEVHLRGSAVDVLMVDSVGALRYLPFSGLYDSATGEHS